MARYIDADALISEIEKTIKVNKSPHYEMRYWEDGMTCAIDIIEDAPAADVVEVVRCKDCKHYRFADNRAFGFPVKRCEWTGFEDVDDFDYCSRGERKEDEQIH